GDLRGEEGEVEMLALARALAVCERGADGDRRVHAGDDVGDRHARTLRAATRRAVRLAGHAHHAAHALDHEVVARPLAIRAGMAETGDRAVHEARVQGAQVLVAEAIAPEITILIVLDQHIAAAHELTRNRLT